MHDRIFYLYRELLTPHWRKMTAGVIMLFISSFATLATPWLASRLTDMLLNGDVLSMSLQTVFLSLYGVLALQAFAVYRSRLLLASLAEEVQLGLRGKLFRHVQALPVNYLEQRSTGSLMSYFTNDISIVGSFLSNTTSALLPQLTVLVTALGIVFWMKPAVALLVVAASIVFVLVTRIVSRNVRPLSAQVLEVYEKVVAKLEESLQVNPIVKAYSLEEPTAASFAKQNEEYRDAAMAYFSRHARIGPVVQLVGGAMVIGAIWVMSRKVSEGGMTVPELIGMLLYGILITRPIAGLAAAYGLYLNAAAASARLIEVLEHPVESIEREDLLLPPNSATDPKDNCSIHFSGIGFAYPGRNRLFSDFNLEIADGETLAITGANGSGKSTLAKLLVRFLEPTEGRIFIGNRRIDEMPLPLLRSQVCYVQQRNLLFNASIRYNISLGQNYSTEELARVTEPLGLDELIASLPEGLDTQVGEQGSKLSGGQCQRIAIARALIRNPAVLVLDEATSMFDPDAEKNYIGFCRDALARATVIIITHRPASLALADRIIHLPSQQ